MASCDGFAYNSLLMEVRMSKKLSTPSQWSAATHRETRLAREAVLLEEGRADIRAGRCISGADVDAWLEGLDGDHELHVPGRQDGRLHR